MMGSNMLSAGPDIDTLIRVLDHVHDVPGCIARIEEIKAATEKHDVTLREANIARVALSTGTEHWNKWEKQLAAKEADLNAREQTLAAREAALTARETAFRAATAATLAAAEAPAKPDAIVLSFASKP